MISVKLTMTLDELVLHEAERWFRAKLRGETAVESHETALFTMLAERQSARSSTAYVGRDLVQARPRISPPSILPVTQPPPPGIHHDWPQGIWGAPKLRDEPDE